MKHAVSLHRHEQNENWKVVTTPKFHVESETFCKNFPRHHSGKLIAHLVLKMHENACFSSSDNERRHFFEKQKTFLEPPCQSESWSIDNF